MATQAFLNQAYLAYFGRPADLTGLATWSAPGVTETQVEDAFFASAESQALYGGTFNAAMIDAIYLNLFGRHADAGGVTYYLNQVLTLGNLTPASAAIAIMNGAQGTDIELVNNKLVAAAAFTAALDTTAEMVGYSTMDAASVAREFLATITSTPATPAQIDAAVAASIDTGTVGNSIPLTTGQDTVLATSAQDTIIANIIDNANTFQSGDYIDGGAGADTLSAMIGNSQDFAIAAQTVNVETVAIRAQAVSTDTTDNNTSFTNEVQIDAQDMVGVLHWTDTNSRADLLIEDVRILDSQVTEDITIEMRETDPGHVDFGVYFDQYSLRSETSSSSNLSLELMDTRNAAIGEDPLTNNPYIGFAFTVTLGGVSKVIGITSPAIDAATTYPELLAAIQAALATGIDTNGVDITPYNLTASIGANFQATDTLTSIVCTGQSIVINSTTAALSEGEPGTGWVTDGVLPPSSGLHTDMSAISSSAADLVTSTVILDDVGRGSTGGDLVIGGLSVGDTSNSGGVQRFKIEVRDNSKLETIQSTNNSLEEVIIHNGVTTSHDWAYGTVEQDAGKLTVNGNSGINGAYASAAADATAAGTVNESLPGTVNAVTGVTNSQTATGFTDVRLIDASTMTGEFAFTADFSQKSIAKYLSLEDIQALPEGDNVAVTYTGGTNDDTMDVRLDRGVVSSNSHIVSGREDFTFNFNGGTGDDAITVSMNGLQGGDQAWYTNQKLNANVFIDAGDGNDTIRTPGAGDVVITAGAGDDTVYTDNTGALTFAAATGYATAAAAAYSAAQAVILAEEQAAFVLENATGFVTSDGVAVGTFITPTAVVAGLATLDQLTPTNPPALPVITHAALAAGTAAAAAGGFITLAQKVALDAAYNSATGGVVTPAVAIGGPSTIVGAAAVAGNVTAAELTAGDTLLATYVAAAKAAEAADTAAVANSIAELALGNATQDAVVAAYMAVNGVENMVTGAVEIGTATMVAGLATLHSALVAGATQAAAVAAVDAATNAGILTGGQPAALMVAVGAGAMDAVDAAAVTAILSPMQNAAAIANATAQAAYTAALAADAAAVDTQADIVAATLLAAQAATAVADAADTAADAALAAAAADLAASQAINTALVNLKAAVVVGTLQAGLDNAIANATAAIADAIALSAADGTGAVIVDPLAAHAVALATLAGAPLGLLGVTAAQKLAFDTGALGVYDADSVDSIIMDNTTQTAELTILVADRAATALATENAYLAALAAENSGNTSLIADGSTAVYVFDTSNQTNTYNLTTMDDRNLADLKSDVNDSYNFFNATVAVTFKGLVTAVPVVVAGTNAHTTDLQINQAIKHAVNDDAVLSKLLLVEDGPANSLVVTSLIDGVQATTDLSVSVTLPTTVTAADLTAAIAGGVVPAAATIADLVAAMTTAKALFDANGDYTTQFAESGAGNDNVPLTGDDSVTSSDNTILLGTGNDVLVLGTTVETSLLTSSNEKVVFNVVDFGNDVIVHFNAAGLGIDQLDFTGLHGSGAVAFGSLTLNNSIVVAAETAANDTPAEIAALFTDSATAINHVYIAYGADNIGSVYQVADAAGVAAGSVTATLVGTIDLADTLWSTLTVANFA